MTQLKPPPFTDIPNPENRFWSVAWLEWLRDVWGRVNERIDTILGTADEITVVTVVRTATMSLPPATKLDGATASRLLATNASRITDSVANLAAWVAGTADEINVADDGDGTVTIGIVDPLIVGKGGTGAATLTDHGILLGSGVGAVTPLGVATNGQLPIGSTGADPVLATLTDSNLVKTTLGAGSITFNDTELEFYIQAVV